eukprot:6785606-Heterocapsa_arctica.AAC.1
MTVPNVSRGEGEHVPTVHSGVHYTKGPTGQWDSQPARPAASQSPPPTKTLRPTGVQAYGDA